MTSYESTYFGLRMQIPDGWEVQTQPDEGMAEFARSAANWKPADPANVCFGATRTLVYATLSAPGAPSGSAAGIEFQACVQSDDCMLQTEGGMPLKKWNLNGLQVLYNDDFRDYPPEHRYYRFPRWKISPGLWLYASINASGKARFDYALSVFETLAPLHSASKPKKAPLYEREPWNVAPSFFRMTSLLNNYRTLSDLVLDCDISEEALNTNRSILCGWNAAPDKWTPMQLRRRSRTRSLDCHYGHQALYSAGVFSGRAIEVLRPHISKSVTMLPCTVGRKPYYYLCFGKGVSYLDIANSQISRFDDGRIMKIDRYLFKNELAKDPLVFAIPEEHLGIFATGSIPSIVVEARLTGIAFYPVDGNGREYTCR